MRKNKNFNYKYIDRTSPRNNNIDMTYFVPVKGYEGLYMIDLVGNVTSYHKKTPNVLCQENKNGYKRVHLHKNGVNKKVLVHKVQMMSRNFNYTQNISNGLEIDHWDNVRDNNHVYNLSMISKSENVRKRYRKDKI